MYIREEIGYFAAELEVTATALILSVGWKLMQTAHCARIGRQEPATTPVATRDSCTLSENHRVLKQTESIFTGSFYNAVISERKCE